MTYSHDDSSQERREARAALFVDYESIYEALDRTLGGRREPHGLIGEMIEALQRSLQEDRGTRPVVSKAYADFAAMTDDGDNIQRALYVQGVEPRFVPGSIEANTIEIQLCVDAMELLHHRSDVTMFVLLTGRRTYLPLVRALRGHGRHVLVAGLEEPPTLKGVPNVEGEWFFPARDLLSTASRQTFEAAEAGEKHQVQFRRREYVAGGTSDSADRTDGRAATNDRTDAAATPRDRTDGAAALDDPMLIRTLQIVEEYFGQYEEVYLTPLLRKMSELLDERTYDPKTLVSELEQQAAVRLEKRQGVPHDYTVLILEEDHPDVQRVRADGQSATERLESAGHETDSGADRRSSASDPSDSHADDRQLP